MNNKNMKILIYALSGIGDALMFTPSIIKLRESYPDAQIDALVMFKGAKDIYERIPELSNVYFYDFLNSSLFPAIKYLTRFRKKYDVSINVYPANRREYNVINFLSGAPKRAGVKYLRQDFKNLGCLNNIRITESDKTHNVETNLKLVEEITETKNDYLPDLVLNLSDDETDFAEKYLAGKNITKDDLVIGFHAGCATLKNHIKRRWEPEKFAELATLLASKHKAKVLIFGGPEEKELKGGIVEKCNSDSVISVETDNLLKSAAVMKRCNVFVTNDSALMHIASALSLNVVAIIGPTNINFIHPWNTKHEIVSLELECSPCFFYSPKPLTCTRSDLQFKCIKEISVDRVLQAIKKFLKD